MESRLWRGRDEYWEESSVVKPPILENGTTHDVHILHAVVQSLASPGRFFWGEGDLSETRATASEYRPGVLNFFQPRAAFYFGEALGSCIPVVGGAIGKGGGARCKRKVPEYFSLMFVMPVTNP